MQMAVSYPKELSKCSNEEIYLALLEHVKKLAAQKAGKDTAAVSYTHLDVYKRQVVNTVPAPSSISGN